MRGPPIATGSILPQVRRAQRATGVPIVEWRDLPARAGSGTRSRARLQTALACQAELVLGHIGINVPDLPAAKAYYGALMPLLGFEPFLDADDQFAYRPAAGKPGTFLFVYPTAEPGAYSRHRTGLQHLAFMVPARSVVRAAHSLAVDLGSETVHEPRTFPEYPPPYYAAFWLDPFGVMLEAVCHHDRD